MNDLSINLTWQLRKPLNITPIGCAAARRSLLAHDFKYVLSGFVALSAGDRAFVGVVVKPFHRDTSLSMP
jgi:hypothetical protein